MTGGVTYVLNLAFYIFTWTYRSSFTSAPLILYDYGAI